MEIPRAGRLTANLEEILYYRTDGYKKEHLGEALEIANKLVAELNVLIKEHKHLKNSKE